MLIGITKNGWKEIFRQWSMQKKTNFKACLSLLSRFKVITCTFLLTFSCVSSCKKFVKIPEPVNSITTSDTFSTNATATSALMGVYNDILYAGNLSYGRAGITIFCGLSADELNNFNMIDYVIPFQTNTLQSNNSSLSSSIWTPAYFDIYLANAVIEGLQTSIGVTDAVKKQLTGEAKFLRAFCHFYLTNLFGDIPIVITTSWSNTSLLARSPVSKVYQQIINDLKDAQNLLNDGYVKPDNSVYPITSAERTRVNKSAATALLARAYLYIGDYVNAESHASMVISNTSVYSLSTNLNNVFLKNSSEAIWQLQPNSSVSPYTTYEGNQLIPSTTSSSPFCNLTSQLLGAFETGDKRRVSWVDSTTFQSVKYYYPKKYKVKTGTVNTVPTEYYMVLRLSEQYLIRAEARALQNNDLSKAIADLDTIRVRAGLPILSNSLTQAQVLTAIAKERRIEFFCEWGHRWLDLKRTGQADAILTPIKSLWQPTAKLYPIPVSELQRDPNLVQNPGYQ